MTTIWNRNFIVALIGYFFLFMSITLFFLFPLFLKQFDPSRTQIGLIMGIHSIMAIFIRPFFGRLIDIRGRRKISLLGIAFLIMVLPCFHLIRNAGVLPVVLRALTGLGWGISMTATLTICSDLAPVERHGYGAGAQSRHASMMESIADCQVLIAGGMGWGAYESLKSHNIEGVVTDIADIDEAVKLYLDGKLPNLMERLH